jgi:hypothetical protein
MVVVDQIEVFELDVVPVVDHLDQEKLLVHMMFVMNVEVNLKKKNFHSLNNYFSFLDRGHYAYDCEIRLKRQRRMKYVKFFLLII